MIGLGIAFDFRSEKFRKALAFADAFEGVQELTIDRDGNPDAASKLGYIGPVQVHIDEVFHEREALHQATMAGLHARASYDFYSRWMVPYLRSQGRIIA